MFVRLHRLQGLTTLATACYLVVVVVDESRPAFRGLSYFRLNVASRLRKITHNIQILKNRKVDLIPSVGKDRVR